MPTNKIIRVRPVSSSNNVSEVGIGLLDKMVVPITGLSAGYGVACHGEKMYISDSTSHVIFVIKRGTASRVFVGAMNQSGTADGQGSVARFNTPQAICVDPSGVLWVVDKGNRLLRRVTENANVYTVALLTGTTPTGISVDEAGNIFLLDTTA